MWRLQAWIVLLNTSFHFKCQLFKQMILNVRQITEFLFYTLYEDLKKKKFQL